MLAYAHMLHILYYAQNSAGIIRQGLFGCQFQHGCARCNDCSHNSYNCTQIQAAGGPGGL